MAEAAPQISGNRETFFRIRLTSRYDFPIFWSLLAAW